MWLECLIGGSHGVLGPPLPQVILLGESFGGLLSLALALHVGRDKLKGEVAAGQRPDQKRGQCHGYQGEWRVLNGL